MDSNCLDVLLKDIKRLLLNECYQGAEHLSSLVVSNLSSTQGESRRLAAVLEYLGDSLWGQKEIKRAAAAYRQALQQLKTRDHGSSGQSYSTMSIDSEARLRQKEARCEVLLRDLAAAVKCLEAIPAKFRDNAVLTLLAGLYQESNLRRHAVATYKEALALAPFSLDVIRALVALGVEGTDIWNIIVDSVRHRHHDVSLSSISWLSTLIEAFVHLQAFEHERAAEYFRLLVEDFPNNPYLLTQLARTLSFSDQKVLALQTFQRIRLVDMQYVEGMDTMARLLFIMGNEAELNRLANDMLAAAPNRPETWLCAAWFAAIKKDFEHASSFIDKAVMLNPRYSEAFRTRGVLLQRQGNHDLAMIAFSQANSVEKHFLSFSGLIDTYLELDKLKDAAVAVRELLKFYPKAAETYYIMGKVLARSASGFNESVRAFGKALKIQPQFKAAAIALSVVLLEQNRADDAAACLEQIIAKVSSADLRLWLGKAYVALSRYHEALDQLQISVSLGGGSEEEASKEIDRVAGLLRQQNGADFQTFEEHESVLEDAVEDSFAEDYDREDLADRIILSDED